MTFSVRLKKLRANKKMTQEELAQRSGLSSRMIQKYEYGIAHPSYDAAKKLASALEISISELFGDNVAQQADALVSKVIDLFAGGELEVKDMDVMMKAITEAYWLAKEKNETSDVIVGAGQPRERLGPEPVAAEALSREMHP